MIWAPLTIHWLRCEAPAVYSMQFPIEKSNNVDDEFTTPVPCWGFYGGVPYPFLQLHTSVSKREYNYFDGNNVQDKELEKQISPTGSNSGSINAAKYVELNSGD